MRYKRKSSLYTKTDNVVVHLGRLPEWISEQKTVKVSIKSQECVITSLPSSLPWKEYRIMNSFCGKNLLPSQNQDLVNGRRLTRSTGGNVTVNFMAKLPDDINYCCKIIGACINPFLGFDLCHHAIYLLNNEAFQCLRKVQENMDFVLSMAITEAQCSDVECKERSLPMDAPWLAASNLGGSLFHVKEEEEDPLSVGKYPVMYAPNPLEISRDVTGPLATDELILLQPLASTPFKEEGLECMAESTGAIVTDFDWKLVGAEDEPSPEEKDAFKLNVKEDNEDRSSEENYPDMYTQNPAENTNNISDPLANDDLFHVKEEEEDPLSVGKYPVMYAPNPLEISRDVTGPLATDELILLQPLASTPFKEEGLECMAESTGAIVTDFDWKLVGAEDEPSPEEKDAFKLNVKEDNEDRSSEENYPDMYTQNPAENTNNISDPLANDDLFHVKEEEEDPLSVGKYPVMYAPNPLEISRDVTGPLATDELILLQPLASTPFKEEGLECMAESTGAIVTDFDWKLVGAEDEPSPEEKDAFKLNVKEDNEDRSSEENYPDMYTQNPAENTNNISDPLANDDLILLQPLASTPFKEEGLECMAESTGAIVTDFDWKLVGAEDEPSPEEKDAFKEEEYVEELGVEEGPFEGTLGEEEAYDKHYEGGYEETMEEDTAEEGQLEVVMEVRASSEDGSTEAITLPTFLWMGNSWRISQWPM